MDEYIKIPRSYVVKKFGRLSKRWVWHSTPQSVAKGQKSILAAAEIPVSMALFWWITSVSHYPILSLVALLAVPLLLLRSPKSIRRGRVISLKIMINIFKNMKMNILIIGSISIVIVWSIALNLAVSMLKNDFGHIFVVMIFSIIWIILCQLWFSLLVFLMSLLIRMFSTALFLPEGLLCYTINCRENLFVVDCMYPTELLPRINSVYPYMSIKGLWSRIGRKEMGDDFLDIFLRSLINMYLLILIQVPAVLYRLNIKANAWLWGSIALAFSPTLWEDYGNIRRKSVSLTHAITLFMICIVWVSFPIWILYRFLPPDTFTMYSWQVFVLLESYLPSPTWGISFVVLVLLWLSIAALGLSTFIMRAQFSVILGSEAIPFTQKKKKMHQTTALVQRWLKITTALSLSGAVLYILKLASQGTFIIQAPIWDWLKAIL